MRPAGTWEMSFPFGVNGLEQSERLVLRRGCSAEEMRYSRSSAGDTAGSGQEQKRLECDVAIATSRSEGQRLMTIILQGPLLERADLRGRVDAAFLRGRGP